MITQAVTYVHDVHTYGIFMPCAKTLAHRQLATESRIAFVCRYASDDRIFFLRWQNRSPNRNSANEHRALVGAGLETTVVTTLVTICFYAGPPALRDED